MSPLRVWIDHEQAPACKPGAHVKLSADESAHVVRSLRARRGDAPWMARAISSLPTPVSPPIRTVDGVGATLAMRW